jgi:hypothetical protein
VITRAIFHAKENERIQNKTKFFTSNGLFDALSLFGGIVFVVWRFFILRSASFFVFQKMFFSAANALKIPNYVFCSDGINHTSAYAKPDDKVIIYYMPAPGKPLCEVLFFFFFFLFFLCFSSTPPSSCRV